MKPAETRIAFAMQLYDTSQPSLSIRQCERIAGLKHPNLLIALRRRELKHEMRCPSCGLVPGEKLSLVRAAKMKRSKQRKEVKARREGTPIDQPLIDQYRAAAKRLYGNNPAIEFDDQPAVSLPNQDGAYVQAWLRVSTTDLS